MIKILTAILSVFVVLTLGACLTAGTLPFRAVRGLVRSRALPAWKRVFLPHLNGLLPTSG